MFDFDRWQEIFSTIRKNKTRTILTSFSVAWGIFILVLLLGMGAGIENGVKDEFKDDAINSLWIYSRQTSMPYQGLKPGRDIRFTNEDHDYIRESVDGVEHMTGRYNMWGNNSVTYKSESSSYSIRSTHPDHKYLENTIITRGRFINDADLQQFRKVAVIGQLVRQDLFKGENPLGKYIKVRGIPFQVVGEYRDEGSEGEMRIIYLPLTTSQKVFNGQNTVHQMMMTVENPSLEKTERMAEDIRKKLAARHNFDVRDHRAVSVRNTFESFEKYMILFANIRKFIWVIGSFSLFAGIIGISNIMLIVVKERTREIGVRKAMGATPGSIVGLILQEAILVTSLAGYMGLVFGVFVLEMAATYITDAAYFKNPEIDLSIAITATVLLVLFGSLAGLFPAIRAARIQPIVALREQ